MAAATGRSTQGHCCYAVNQGAWWLFYLTSTQGLAALYNTNANPSGGSWTAPSGSPLTLIKVHNSEGRNFGFGYANISSTDVLHMSSAYIDSSGNAFTYASRFVLNTTWTNSNSEAEISTEITGYGVGGLAGGVATLDSSNYPVQVSQLFASGDGAAAYDIGSHADSGSAWTAGYGTDEQATGSVNVGTSCFVAPLGSRGFVLIGDNGNNATNGTSFDDLWWNSWNGSSLSQATNSHASVIGTTVTETDSSQWGAVARTTSDVHCVVLSNNSNAFTHRRWNGTSWSAGSTVGTLTLATHSGISLVTDGTSVWMFATDSSKNIQYNKWISGGGWGGWTVLEAARTNTPAYVTACYSAANNQIMVAWTESTGSNYNIIGSNLATSVAQDPIGVASDTFSSMMSLP